MLLPLLAACSDPADPGKDTGLPADSGDTAADSGESADTPADSARDSVRDSAQDGAPDTAADSGSDTAGTCDDATCVAYACWCGECEDSDIQCVTQAWADANPCMLDCPIAECPELSTTRCHCDEATGECVRT